MTFQQVLELSARIEQPKKKLHREDEDTNPSKHQEMLAQ